jgi:CBS-domain-containing membrane protein
LGEQEALREILLACDLMTECKEFVLPNKPLQEAINSMKDNHLEFLPVIARNEKNKLAGFLSLRAINKQISIELLRRQQTVEHHEMS